MEKWRNIQRNSIRCWQKLAEFLELDKKSRTYISQKSTFPLNLPLHLASKIEKNSLSDPIFLQFVPVKKKRTPSKRFALDPVCDQKFQITPNLLHKYQGRVLLMPTSSCAMHCRYCFRQNYPYETISHHLEASLDYIKKNKSIFEVILSGGDPLSLSNKSFTSLVHKLEEIDHLKLIRLHTRFPIGIPQRIDPAFVHILASLKKQIIFTLHINHPKEWDPILATHIQMLQKHAILILSQTVLLKGINDDPTTLKELFLALVSNGVIPYYLHQLDKVKGAEHFLVSKKKGKEFMEELRKQLPGYALPKYVEELPFRPYKVLIS